LHEFPDGLVPLAWSADGRKLALGHLILDEIDDVLVAEAPFAVLTPVLTHELLSEFYGTRPGHAHLAKRIPSGAWLPGHERILLNVQHWSGTAWEQHVWLVSSDGRQKEELIRDGSLVSVAAGRRHILLEIGRKGYVASYDSDKRSAALPEWPDDGGWAHPGTGI
jgi:hypothetical protein